MNILILIISVLIYLTFGLPSFIYLIISILTSYIGAILISKRKSKLILLFLLIINITSLIIIKLNNYLPLNIIAPIGISYYTLQIISYLVDIYKEKYKPETNFLVYTLYIVYIPHIFIGPIIRYDDLKESLSTKRNITIPNFLNGSLRIIWGLFKKLVISSRIYLIIHTITINPTTYNGSYALLAMLLYSIELYTDFSGGIDIVLGTSKILGFNLKENFNNPYQAETVKEFWHRWHISLSTWLKDYIYIPLGGNKVSNIRKNFNVIITFLISGLWHGFNYLLWGLLNGILVILSNSYKTKYKYLNRIINYLIISLLWSFFIWNDNLLALKMITSIITNFNIRELINNIFNIGLSNIEWLILIISTFILILFDNNKDFIISKIKSLTSTKKLIIILSLSMIVLVFGVYGIGFNISDFIYSKF